MADLPVAVLERGMEGGVDVGSGEGRQGEDGAAADGGLVATRSQDGREAGGVAERWR